RQRGNDHAYNDFSFGIAFLLARRRLACVFPVLTRLGTLARTLLRQFLFPPCKRISTRDSSIRRMSYRRFPFGIQICRAASLPPVPGPPISSSPQTLQLMRRLALSELQAAQRLYILRTKRLVISRGRINTVPTTAIVSSASINPFTFAPRLRESVDGFLSCLLASPTKIGQRVEVASELFQQPIKDQTVNHVHDPVPLCRVVPARFEESV